MTSEMIRRFTSLVYFLGGVLGPDYEITLYDLELDSQSVIAIANGRISGQTIGSPLPEVAQDLLRQQQYEQSDCILNFTSHLQATGKAIRSSALFIKDSDEKPVGLLGINFDDSRFLSLANDLLDLIHPCNFVRQQYSLSETQPAAGLSAPPLGNGARREPIYNDVSSMIQEIFSDSARSLPVPPDRMTQDERILFISQLKARGMFRLKGAVQYTAEKLGCSQASVYRYLSKVKSEQNLRKEG